MDMITIFFIYLIHYRNLKQTDQSVDVYSDLPTTSKRTSTINTEEADS
jgi:hypothetical protein